MYSQCSASRRESIYQDGVKYGERIDKLTEYGHIQSLGVKIGTVA